MTLAQHSGSAKVLVVDDEPAILSFVGRILTEAGYATARASDGPQALNIIQKSGAFDLLVTDQVMPRMTGTELAERVRKADPAVKVLYVTGYRDQLLQNKAMLWEDEAFLDKPFTKNVLLDAVSLLLFSKIDPPSPERATDVDTAGPASSRSLRVLMVEDLEADAVSIQRELERSGFEVKRERVDTKAKLVAALDRAEWDMIITDHAAAHFDAVEVLNVVQARGLAIPCLLVSEAASEETAVAAMKIGADDFVSKRDLTALAPSVARLLDDAPTRRARLSATRLRFQNGQELEVLEWGPDAAVLSGHVGLAPAHDHECLLLADGGARRVRIRVVRSDVSQITAGRIVYRTVTTVLGEPPSSQT